MKDDLAGRLRNWKTRNLSAIGSLIEEAASEIERLRLTREESVALNLHLDGQVVNKAGQETIRSLLYRMAGRSTTSTRERTDGC